MQALTGPTQSKQSLRRDLLAARQALPDGVRALLDARIAGHLLHDLALEPDQAIAAYHACRGEPEMGSALLALHAAFCRVHLPVLVGQAMQFRRWTPGARLTANRYGIPEPLDGEPCAPQALNWVLLPLVAFSAAGGRLGMGGGYYDRTFGFCLQQPAGSRPPLLGVAYSLQEVDRLPMEAWDVPLDGVVTEQGLRWFSPRPA